MDLWRRIRGWLRLARRPYEPRIVGLVTQPIEVIEVTSDDIARDIAAAEAGMNLALDVGDWVEAAVMLAWLKQLRKALALLKDDDG